MSCLLTSPSPCFQSDPNRASGTDDDAEIPAGYDERNSPSPLSSPSSGQERSGGALDLAFVPSCTSSSVAEAMKMFHAPSDVPRDRVTCISFNVWFDDAFFAERR